MNLIKGSCQTKIKTLIVHLSRTFLNDKCAPIESLMIVYCDRRSPRKRMPPGRGCLSKCCVYNVRRGEAFQDIIFGGKLEKPYLPDVFNRAVVPFAVAVRTKKKVKLKVKKTKTNMHCEYWAKSGSDGF